MLLWAGRLSYCGVQTQALQGCAPFSVQRLACKVGMGLRMPTPQISVREKASSNINLTRQSSTKESLGVAI